MKKITRTKVGYKFSSDIFDLPPDKKLASFQQGLWFSAWLGGGMFPRVVIKKIKFSWKGADLLTPVAEGLGLVDNTDNKLINMHYKRLVLRGGVYMGIVLPVVFALFFAMFAGIGYMISKMAHETFVVGHAEFFITTFWIIAFFALITLFMIEFYLIKLSGLLLDRLFADTLCVRASLGVLVELVSPQVLDNPLRKRILLAYINELARFTQLLHLTFASPSEEENEKIRKRFRALESHIREQARMAIFPTEKTLDNLRENFMALTKIFISGRYGDFPYAEEESNPTPVKPLTWYEVFGKWFGRLVGLGLPTAALYFLIVRPEYFSNLPVNPNTISVVALAWLALSLDSILGLGVTARIVATAKEFKDLV